MFHFIFFQRTRNMDLKSIKAITISLVLIILSITMITVWIGQITSIPNNCFAVDLSSSNDHDDIVHSDIVQSNIVHSDEVCNDSIYKFKTSSTSIFNDTNVFDKCGVGSTVPINQSFHQNDPEHPLIRTKCGLQTGHLVSFFEPRNITYYKSSYIPNIVHYVYFGKWKMSFLEYLSFKSVDKHLRPKYLFIHGDTTISGHWWTKIKKEVANVYMVPWERPLKIQGKRITKPEHCADITRIQILQGE